MAGKNKNETNTNSETRAERMARLTAELKAEQEAARREAEESENKLKARVSTLHTEFGFASAADFHKAYGRTMGLFANRGGKKSKLTNEKRDEMIEVLKAGNKTAAEIAAQFGVSVGTVNVTKRNAGLTQARAAA